ncbi:MAG TPA: hypothetical protein DCX32_04495 [Candidatus Moranbacteria bacterium]|nr:MAG: hypothetical protein UW87_C0002G0036 [Candidatus Moranbacteria bacterium GW2011_GWC2_45_10]KKT95206.1 MAG: hypothetical protein UW95_C0003G0048 [Parcubacteria group bacterium GW2011_GWC1_45_14]HAV11767.1 hypothetical protein [Candidatus Moranbacteria bacterium]
MCQKCAKEIGAGGNVLVSVDDDFVRHAFEVAEARKSGKGCCGSAVCGDACGCLAKERQETADILQVWP